MRVAVRAPDHLGDAVMALPAVEALAIVGTVTVYTRGRWGTELYDPFVVRRGDAELDPDEFDVGVVLKPSWHAAWTWRGLRRRVGIGRAGLLTEALDERVEHRREGYARVVAAMGGKAAERPVFRARAAASVLPAGFVALNPHSPTATVRWPYFARLAERLAAGGSRVIGLAGPGDGAAARGALPGVRVEEIVPLRELASALDRASVVVSNDSGLAHFADACGVPVVVVHGSTTAELTGVGTGVDGGRLWCRPCYRKHCLWGGGCLERVKVESVEAAARAAMRIIVP